MEAASLEEDGHESKGKNVVAKSALKQVNKEAGAKNDCEAANRLQDSRAPLFAALSATEAAEIVHTAQTGSSTATETTELRVSSPQLVHQGLGQCFLRRVPAKQPRLG